MKKTFGLMMVAMMGMASLAWADLPALTQITSVRAGEHVLANSFSQVLYTFDADQGGKSACSATCAEKWPPFIVTAAEAATLKAPFATIARTNGLVQVTHGGSPLYTFYLDRVPSDAKGDGLGGVWHIVPVR